MGRDWCFWLAPPEPVLCHRAGSKRGFWVKDRQQGFPARLQAVWCRSPRLGVSGRYLAAAKELAVLALIRKLVYTKKRCPLPPALLSCVCQGRRDCQEREGDALTDTIQLELLVPWPGRGDTVVCSVIFPARLILLAKGRFVRWESLRQG